MRCLLTRFRTRVCPVYFSVGTRRLFSSIGVLSIFFFQIDVLLNQVSISSNIQHEKKKIVYRTSADHSIIKSFKAEVPYLQRKFFRIQLSSFTINFEEIKCVNVPD